MKKFGPNQLYICEETANEVADALVHLGFEFGEAADEQHYDGKAMQDMSVQRKQVKELQAKLLRIVGLLDAYELVRETKA